MPSRFRRICCLLLLVPWLICLLLPCPLIVLAVQQEILITHSDLPGNVLRIWVLQSRDARGIGFVNAYRVEARQESHAVSCVVSDVQFLLWSGSAEEAGALPVQACTCYTRRDDAWLTAASGEEACRVADLTSR